MLKNYSIKNINDVYLEDIPYILNPEWAHWKLKIHKTPYDFSNQILHYYIMNGFCSTGHSFSDFLPRIQHGNPVLVLNHFLRTEIFGVIDFNGKPKRTLAPSLKRRLEYILSNNVKRPSFGCSPSNETKKTTPPSPPETLSGQQQNENTPQKETKKDPSGRLTYDAEGNDNPSSQYYSRVIHWPATNESGVTVGRGYDMGSRSESEVYNDMIASGIDPIQARKISKGAGLKGKKAKDFVIKNKSDIGEITLSQQESLFSLIYPNYVSRTKANYAKRTKTSPTAKAWDDLDTPIQEVLVDFVYQGFTEGDNPMLKGSNNDKQELIEYIKKTPILVQYEKGRNRVKYLEQSK